MNLGISILPLPSATQDQNNNMKFVPSLVIFFFNFIYRDIRMFYVSMDHLLGRWTQLEYLICPVASRVQGAPLKTTQEAIKKYFAVVSLHCAKSSLT